MLVKRENSHSHLQVTDHRRESSNHKRLQGAIWLGYTSEQVRPQAAKTISVFPCFKNTGQRFVSIFPQYLVLGMNPYTVKKFKGEPRPPKSLISYRDPNLYPNPKLHTPQSPTSQCLAPSFTQMHRPKPGHLPFFLSYPPLQSINNPDSPSSQLHSQFDSLHNSHTYHHGPKVSHHVYLDDCTPPCCSPCLHFCPCTPFPREAGKIC